MPRERAAGELVPLGKRSAQQGRRQEEGSAIEETVQVGQLLAMEKRFKGQGGNELRRREGVDG